MGKGPLEFEVVAERGPARAAVVRLPHGAVQTPVYMPVGTQGTLKGVTTEQIAGLAPRIMLSNTFFLNLRPGTDVLETFDGLHNLSHL